LSLARQTITDIRVDFNASSAPQPLDPGDTFVGIEE
jgi:hypothetical protein